MSEIVTTYKLDDLEQPLPMDREEFYAEQIEAFEKTGKPTRAVEVVQILLSTPEKELILQKRSHNKKHNPGLIDKTIGGHVRFGDTPTFTVMAETLQELDIPSFVLHSDDEFKKTYKLLKEYVSRSAFIQFVDSRTTNVTKVFGDKKVLIANKYDFYLGIYRGSIKPADREAAGVLFYDFETLAREMKLAPDMFTDDLRFFLERYHQKMESFLSTLDA